MAEPEHIMHCLQRFSVERLRLAVAAPDSEENAQIVDAGQGIRMAGPEHFAPPRRRFPQVRPRLPEVALRVVEGTQIVDAGERDELLAPSSASS